MRDRFFGVEIECGSGMGHEGVARRLRDFIPEWFVPTHNEKGIACRVGYDGSGVEVRTPPLRGEQGFSELRAVMEFLVDECGAYVTESDGLHIHHDAPEFLNSRRLQKALIRTWRNHDPVIKALVAPVRHNRGCCPDWTDAQLESYGTEVEGYYSNGVRMGPRGALNMTALPEHGTVELRLHEGTLNPDVTEAWIRFGQGFLDRVVKRRAQIQCVLPQPVGVPHLLDTLDIPAEAKRTLLAKAINGGREVAFA